MFPFRSFSVSAAAAIDDDDDDNDDDSDKTTDGLRSPTVSSVVISSEQFHI